MFLADFHKCLGGPIQYARRQWAADGANADAGLALGDYRKAETDDVNPALEEAVGHLCRQGRFSQQDRDDRMLALLELESGRFQGVAAEAAGVGVQAVAQGLALLNQHQRPQGGHSYHGRNRVGEQVGP